MVKITKQDTTYYSFMVKYCALKVMLFHYTTLAAVAYNLAKVMCFSIIVVALYSVQFQDLLNRSTEPHIEAAKGGNSGGYSG